MSSPTIPQYQDDANTLSELSDALGTLERCQDKRAGLVKSFRSARARPASDGAALEEGAATTSGGDGRRSAQRGTVVGFAGPAQTELVRISESIESIGKRIDVLRTALSPVGSTIYQALRRAKRRPFIARVANGICGGCNMRVPSSQAASVLSRRKTEQCQSCARLLLAEEDPTDAARSNG